MDLIRVLAMDAVEQAGSGHPGTAMSLAPAAYLLFQKVMRHDPADPHWLGRDRFVPSCGHSSLTPYIQLYLSGYGLTLDDLRRYRTWGSLTPGHPEHGLTAGVETTTGPLGQGHRERGRNGDGRPLRERGLPDPAASEGNSLFDHHIYTFMSDGDIEEGISHEVSALAGHQQLGNLIALYDDNSISIEDDTNIAKSEDVAARYEAYGCACAADQLAPERRVPRGCSVAVRRVRSGEGGHRGAVTDRAAHDYRLAGPAQAEHGRRTRLGARRGRGGRHQDNPRLRSGGDLPGRGAGGCARAARLGERTWQQGARQLWDEAFDAWSAAHPEKRKLLDRLASRELPDGWADVLPTFPPDPKGVATRKASGDVLVPRWHRCCLNCGVSIQPTWRAATTPR